MTNVFWSLPDWVKALFKPEGKTDITIKAFKKDDAWMFNKFPITWNETLAFKDSLDKIAEGENKVTIKVTIDESKVDSTWEKALFIDVDPLWPEASIYDWKGETIWLCPWTQWWFGFVPDHLYFKVVK